MRLRTAHPHGVGAEHVGTVGEEGDPAEAFGLALRAQHAVRGIESHQLRIGARIEFGDDGQPVAVAGQGDDEILAVEEIVVASGLVAVERDQPQPVAVEPDRRRRVGSGIAFHRQRRGDHGLVEAEREFETDFGHQPGEGGVILASDDRRVMRLGRGIGHFGIAVGRGGGAGDIHGSPVIWCVIGYYVPMAGLFIFGLGYTAKRIAQAPDAPRWPIEATGSAGNLEFADRAGVAAALARASHVLSSVPPADGSDPVLDRYGADLDGKWLGYLSSTGVYGDAGGAWVDEASPTGGGRRSARSECDARWLAAGARVFRLPGIYGPGRSALDRVREGKAHRIDLPGQVFSRVHVDDIARGVIAAIATGAPGGAYNLADDRPSSQNAVIEEACRLLGCAAPPLQTLDEAGLSPMARGFYAENRRVANGKARRVLGWTPLYPTYREGLAALRVRA